MGAAFYLSLSRLNLPSSAAGRGALALPPAGGWVGLGEIGLATLFSSDAGGSSDLAQWGLALLVCLLSCWGLVLAVPRRRGDLPLLILSFLGGGLFLGASGRAANGLESLARAWPLATGILLFWVSAWGARRWQRGELESFGRALQVLVALVLAASWTVSEQWGELGDNFELGGTFYQPNMLAAFLLATWPLTLGRLWQGAQSESLGLRIGDNLLAIATAFSLFFTYGRSAWLLGGWAVLAVAIYYSRQPGERPIGAGEWWRYEMAGALFTWGVFVINNLVYLAPAWLGALLLGAWNLYPRPSARRFLGVVGGIFLLGLLALGGLEVGRQILWQGQRQGEVSGQSESLLARREFYRVARGIITDHPLQGVGADNYQRFYALYQRDLRWYSQRPHALGLDILCEAGWPALIVAVAASFYWLWGVASLGIKPLGEEGRLAWAWGLGALLLLLHAQLDLESNFLTLPLWGFSLAGCAWGLRPAAEMEWPPLGLATVKIAVGVIALGGLFSLSILAGGLLRQLGALVATRTGMG